MPKIVGLMLARNEGWVLGLTLRAALMYCDEMVVVDHASADGTPGIIAEVAAEFPGRVHPMKVGVAWWDEMDVRQSTLDYGRGRGGTHFAVVDADELLTGNLLPRARQMIEALAPGTMASLPMVATYHSVDRRRIDGPWGRRARISWAFADAPGLSWKPDNGYQHHHRPPHGLRAAPEPAFEDMSQGGIFHFQFVTRARLEAKSAWYKMTEVVRWPSRKTPDELNRMYDRTLREGGGTNDTVPEYTNIPDEWWAPYSALLPRFDPGAEPWHAAEARRLFAHYGAEKFAGLRLHGYGARGDALQFTLDVTPEDRAIYRQSPHRFSELMDVRVQKLRQSITAALQGEGA